MRRRSSQLQLLPCRLWSPLAFSAPVRADGKDFIDAAIGACRASLGYPATGEMTDCERAILITSCHRAVAGSPVIAQAGAGSVFGLKAVLIAQRDEMAGMAPGGTLVGNDGLPVPDAITAALPTLVPAQPEVEEVALLPDFDPSQPPKQLPKLRAKSRHFLRSWARQGPMGRLMRTVFRSAGPRLQMAA